MDQIVATLRRWLNNLFSRPEPVFPARLVEAVQRRFIADDVDYSQPVLLPEWMRQGMNPRQLRTYLHEASSFRFQFDTPYRDVTDYPVETVTDDPLYEWPYNTRLRVLTNCHAACQRNPLAKSIVDYSTSFTIGDGFNLTCKNPDVERVLQEFIDNPDNDIRVYEKQCLRDLQTDGELLLRYFAERGQVVVAPLRPWELQYIETEPGFFRRRMNYLFQFRLEKGDMGEASYKEETVPADDIQHIAINRHGYELRGRPDLFVILPWLRAYTEWLEGRARINHYANAFVWDVSVAAQTPAAMASVVARYQKPPSPGSVSIHSDKEVLDAKNANVMANDASEDGRQIKMMSIAGTRMAEYMLGDGENANLATATAQQLPALTKFSDYQQILINQLWKPMFRRVLQAAVDAGNLPEQVQEVNSAGDPVAEDDGTIVMCDAVDAFEVAYEPLSSAAPQDLAQAMAIYLDRDVVDLETAREEAGFDATVVAKRLEKQRDMEVTDMAQGKRPVPPGLMPQPSPDGQNAPQDAIQQAPA